MITDNLLDPIGFDLETVKHGTMEEFAAWVDSLPVCTNPACPFDQGVIHLAAIEEALATNGKTEEDGSKAQATAASVASQVADLAGASVEGSTRNEA